MQITKHGFIIDSLLTIKSRLEDGFKKIFGQDIILTPDTPDGQMIGLFSEPLSETNECLAFATQMLDPYVAIGEYLDQRVAYAGLVRKPAKFSVCYGITFHGNANVFIPKGTKLKDKNGNFWQTDFDITLGIDGSAIVNVTSVETGPYDLKSQDQLELQQIIIGVDRVVVTQNAVIGADEEGDGELRLRFMLSHSINNNDDRQGLEAYLLNLPDVKQVKVLENYTGTTDENGVPAHSINAIVFGGDDKVIAEALLKKKIGGCGLFGSAAVSIEYKEAIRTVYFDRPTIINPKIYIELKRIEFYSDINTQKIKELLASYVFDIGQDLYASRLYSIINEVKGFEITNMTIDGAQNKVINVREMAVVLEQDIDIKVVT